MEAEPPVILLSYIFTSLFKTPNHYFEDAISIKTIYKMSNTNRTTPVGINIILKTWKKVFSFSFSVDLGFELSFLNNLLLESTTGDISEMVEPSS